LELGGVRFTNVAVRAKGNMGSLVGPKRSLRLDLNKFTKGQKLGGLDKLTFNNLMWDYSFLSDALGYEFFRDAGVPAPRTSYAWLSASVAKQWDRKPLGLYLMVEPVDKSFVAEHFRSKQTAVFKPVTYELFKDLGDEWSAYAATYDLKTTATTEQKARLISLARLVSNATAAQFDAQIGGFIDLDEFARFLACEVLLSNYDSPLTTGQNFYLYLDARSNKFGFIPWDLDAAWGNFWIGTRQELEFASIWHPWVGENRFLERIMAVEQFRRIYRARLEEILTHLFVSHRLNQRISEIAAVIHSPVASESGFRLDKFEQEVGLKPVAPSPGETRYGVNHPAYPLERFIEIRARSVRKQLDGKSVGVIVQPPVLK
jgi:spore coat protein CotH